MAVLLTIAGVLVMCYGLLEAHNFPYVFDTRQFADSSYRQTLLHNGLNWARQLHAIDRAKHPEMYGTFESRLIKPYPYLYYTKDQSGKSVSNIGAVSNIDSFFEELPLYLKRTYENNSAKVYVGISHHTYDAMATDYAKNRTSGTTAFYIAAAGAILALSGFSALLFAAGRSPGMPEPVLGWWDRLYLDIGFLLWAGAVALGVRALFEVWMLHHKTTAEASLVLGAVLATAIALVTLMYGSMVAKRLKRGELLRHTLCASCVVLVVRVIRYVWRNTISKAYNTGPLGVRAAALILGYGGAATFMTLVMLMVTRGGGPFAVLVSFSLFVSLHLLAVGYVVKRASELKAIIEGAETIRKGDLSHRIPAAAYGDLNALAQNINNITDGLQASVSNEVKSERMKAELITNVSHDLKTPLTSIITYVDLLKTEGLQSESAPRYLEILEQKSQRLKVLTDDLFEAAKASSGSIVVNLEKLDVGSLLSQGLGELADRIADARLDFRVGLPQEKVYVKADGRLLWRAMENVLTNALKYALPGSRVYIDAVVREEQVQLTFKNISALPLNIPPEELVERFKRGDEARSTEGSGLGLAIAKSLVELQRGTFKIEIDGDLFKVSMSFPRVA